MFRNQYDNDTTVWSPQGRLFQVEYAMEAVKQGAATVGLKSKDYAVLIALCRASETETMQPKIMPVDMHMGISISGLTADARLICQYMRTECLSYRHSYSGIIPVNRLVTNLGNKMQATTQRYDRRPYGVGILVAGYDDAGSHLYQVMPSAVVLNCKAMAIGSRSQSARTYLERHMDSFENCSMDDLICHGIKAIRGSLGYEENPSLAINVAIVGANLPFKALGDEENHKYLEMAKAIDNPEEVADEVPPSDDDLLGQGPSAPTDGEDADTIASTEDM
ncbi:proteasome subunit alpha type-1 [Drosophila pseudoobscura]|uniref:Proteasome subunit alpha type n=1 Tax=Drosophila pseudoobscura pseudoobscura TaxID=46245 RepID=A0A6I8UIS2_DROPS|nr:proteasome subunit alpha type-1 [Drosophila pseudoobscura]